MQTDQLFEYRAAMEELEVEYGSIEEIRWEAQHSPPSLRFLLELSKTHF